MKTILIAEDEGALRSILKEEIGDRYKVLEANNGNDALQCVRSEAIDLVLLDVVMPGMSGTEVAKNISEDSSIDPKPEVIILSNKDDAETVADALSAEAFTYWVKSDTSLEKIVNEIDSRLG